MQIEIKWKEIITKISQKETISEIYLLGYAYSNFLLQIKQDGIKGLKYVKALDGEKEINLQEILHVNKPSHISRFNSIVMIQKEFIMFSSKRVNYNVSRNPDDEWDRYNYFVSLPGIYLPETTNGSEIPLKEFMDIFYVFLNQNWNPLKLELGIQLMSLKVKDEILHCLLRIKNPENTVHRVEVFELENFMEFYSL